MTTTPALNDDLVQKVARAWASIDGKADRFDSGKIDDHDGYYEGYLAEAKELLKRSGIASALEAQSKEIEALRSALEPFARHIDGMKFDLDNKGDPLPDDQAVGWVYVTNGYFRRARTDLEGA